MARGPVPKSTRSRRDDNAKRQAETVTISDTGTLAGPELPEGILPDGAKWHAQTRQLWQELRRHPLLQDEPGLTWQYLIDTAALHSLAWTNGRWDLAPELRLRLAKVGITPEDRQRLRVRITQRVEAPEVPAGVAEIASRRARLTTDS